MAFGDQNEQKEMWLSVCGIWEECITKLKFSSVENENLVEVVGHAFNIVKEPLYMYKYKDAAAASAIYLQRTAWKIASEKLDERNDISEVPEDEADRKLLLYLDDEQKKFVREIARGLLSNRQEDWARENPIKS